MPRGGSRTSSRPRYSSPNRSASYVQAPSRTYQAPSSVGSRGGMFSGLGGVMAQGMAFGAGSEIAHQAIRGVTGSGHGHPQQVMVQQQPPMTQEYDQRSQQQQNYNKCQLENTQFIDCLKSNGDSISSCQSYFNMLKECEKKF